MGSNEADKPLRRIGASFEQLAAVAKQQQPQQPAMAAGDFSRACSNVSVLFGCLGIAFKFAEMDYVAKVNDLLEASKTVSTLPSMVELDIQKGTVRQAGSHTRNLLRVKRGIDMVKVLFEQILVTEGNSLKDAASKAYAQVFAPHHGWAIRKAVGAGMYALPSKSQLLKKLNEDENSKFGKGSNAEFCQVVWTSNSLRRRPLHLQEFRARLVSKAYTKRLPMY